MMFTTAGLTLSTTSANEPVPTTAAGGGAEWASGVKLTNATVAASATPATAPATQPERGEPLTQLFVIALLSSERC